MIENYNWPESMKRNEKFSVFIRKPGEEKYNEVQCLQVKVGHQKGEYNISSMGIVDFDGKVEFKIIFNNGNIETYDIRPHSYCIEAKLENANTIKFFVEQNEDAPRKLYIRINDDWEEDCLHLLTNPTEKNPVLKSDKNVFVISPGDEIPLVLPSGKDTYYFEKGTHILPKGLWAEIDLGKAYPVNCFELIQDSFDLSDCYVDKKTSDPLKYILEYKESTDDCYKTLFDGRKNKQSIEIKEKIPITNCRYIRINLLGSTLDKGWIFASILNEIKIYSSLSDRNIALGKAASGAIDSFKNITDGNPGTNYTSSSRAANWHAGESFFLPCSGTKIYMEKNSVVKGCFAADDRNDLSITGRGILDSSDLQHEDPGKGEARTGAIWFTGGRNYHIEGITIVDAPMWQVVLNYSKNIIVKNINLIGFAVNADGVHFSGSENALMQGCFVRSCDDLVVAYHYGYTNNITVKGCVFLNDDAHVFLFGLGETKGAKIENIFISDCDVITQQEAPWHAGRFSGVFKYWAHGGNEIQNIVADNVRIDEFRDKTKACVFQLRTEFRFDGEHPGKAMKNILFKNIKVENTDEVPSLIKGYSKDNPILGVIFENYIRGGKKAYELKDCNVVTEGNAEGILIR